MALDTCHGIAYHSHSNPPAAQHSSSSTTHHHSTSSSSAAPTKGNQMNNKTEDKKLQPCEQYKQAQEIMRTSLSRSAFLKAGFTRKQADKYLLDRQKRIQLARQLQKVTEPTVPIENMVNGITPPRNPLPQRIRENIRPVTTIGKTYTLTETPKTYTLTETTTQKTYSLAPQTTTYTLAD